jgi:hypothetical protein
VIEDLALALGVVLGHWVSFGPIIPNERSMSTGALGREPGRVGRSGTATIV